jgi:hypothetical protein
MRVRLFRLFFIALFASIAALPASARDTEVMLSAKAAAESEKGRAVLFDIPFFMKGQDHPKVTEELIEVSTSQSTRGAFRSDEASCNIAFLSAMKVLQTRAQSEKGNAIVDIVSITQDKQTESPSEFRCVAGTAVVHVALKAKIVKMNR